MHIPNARILTQTSPRDQAREEKSSLWLLHCHPPTCGTIFIQILLQDRKTASLQLESFARASLYPACSSSARPNAISEPPVRRALAAQTSCPKLCTAHFVPRSPQHHSRFAARPRLRSSLRPLPQHHRQSSNPARREPTINPCRLRRPMPEQFPNRPRKPTPNSCRA